MFYVKPTQELLDSTVLNATDIIASTVIYSQTINRYFTPDKFNTDGTLGFIASAEEKWSLEESRATR